MGTELWATLYNVLKIFSNRVLWIRIVTNFILSVLVLGMVVVFIAQFSPWNFAENKSGVGRWHYLMERMCGSREESEAEITPHGSKV